MKRIALIGAILGLLLVADGIYMVVSKYNDGETQAWHLPDGWIIIISALILLVASVLAYVLPLLSHRSSTEVAKAVITAEIETEQG
jgi:hypothetical protein